MRADKRDPVLLEERLQLVVDVLAPSITRKRLDLLALSKKLCQQPLRVTSSLVLPLKRKTSLISRSFVMNELKVAHHTEPR